jgi:2-keto-3-deoxy-L-rhamnonate aldolase RhmA
VRSVPGALPQLGYRPKTFAEAAEILNASTMCVVMIESADAVANAEKIAAVPGVDCLFVGGSDLSFALGVPSEYGHTSMRDAVRRVCDAAEKHGKSAGIGGVPDAALVRDYAAIGARLVLAGNDLAMLLDGLRRRAASLRD